MPEKQKDMSGVLFVNDRKEKENQPDYKGRITVDGEERWLSCWEKESRAGGKYWSLAVSPMDPPVEIVPDTPIANSEDDDNLPF